MWFKKISNLNQVWLPSNYKETEKEIGRGI